MKRLIVILALLSLSNVFAQDNQEAVKNADPSTVSDNSVNDQMVQSKTSEKQVKNITVPAGTKFKININTQLATNRNVEGSTFSATIAEDFIFEGDTISTKNSQVIGKIVESKSGKGIGDARLSVQVTEISINKKLTPVVTEPITVKGERRRNAQAEIAAGTIEVVTIKQALAIQKK